VATPKLIFSRDTFRFFNDLARHNQKTWMDANRERYHESVVQPFRNLLDEMAPAMLKLDSNFDVSGRTGSNFSRINRDIRFAKDKTPYRAQMYLKFCVPFAGEGETGELYTGLSAKTATAGFRIYAGSKRKASALGLITDARLAAKPKWPAQQKARLGRRYESYWYAAEKGEWIKHDGWPLTADEWKKLQGWVVRRKLTPVAATRASFLSDLAKIFRDVYPLLRFTSLPD
jgi:uncharacterized protein (DUF2461 family)